MAKDYYKILGIDKNVSPNDLKVAFRKLAHEHHPDKKSGDEAKFKELNEAYQVLSDPKKRAQYDQFGSSFEDDRVGGGQGSGGFSDFTGGFNVNMDDLGDIFSGLGDVFGFSGQDSRRRQSKRGHDIQALLTIDFSEAIFGVEKEISLKKTVKCSKCQGQGREPNTEVADCKTCGGQGRVVRVQRTILGNMQVQMTCETCGGEGKIFKAKCSACRGAGLAQQIVNLKIKIPAGIDNNETIRLSGQGEAAAKGAQAGDLYLKIRVNPDRRFERDGVNIKSRAEISFSQAALGGKIEVATVDGPVDLKIPEGTQSGKIFILRGKGALYLNSRGAFSRVQDRRGDHLIEVIIKTPAGLSKRQKELLKESGL